MLAGRRRRVTRRHVFFTSGTRRYFPDARRAVPRSRGRRRRGMAMGLIVELTVLGCSGSYGAPAARRVQRLPAARRRHPIWVDCGNGTFGHLQEHVAVEDLTAVVLTHGHPDHCVDIYGLHVLLRYGLGRENLPVLRARGPREVPAVAGRPTGATPSTGARSATATPPTVGDIDLRFSRTDHPPPTYAVEATRDGRRTDLHRRHRARLERRRVRPRRRPRAVGGDLPRTPTSRRRSTSRPSRPAPRPARRSAQRLDPHPPLAA